MSCVKHHMLIFLFFGYFVGRYFFSRSSDHPVAGLVLSLSSPIPILGQAQEQCKDTCLLLCVHDERENSELRLHGVCLCGSVYEKRCVVCE